ncbi:MAG: tRNA 2-thiouridine(34) synthase MnmA [Tepidisphaeraceae bacterium]
MSGGVDSSVAAALLQRQGYQVLGVFMRLGSPDGIQFAPENSHGHKQGCCSVLDAADARRVADSLHIPFYVLNFQDEFSKVVDYFVDEYNRGRTPNPCVRCNDWLKFGRLAQYAQAVEADFVASGHYARVAPDPQTGKNALFRALDPKKDQSYVLFGMTRWALDHTLLPIGQYQKQDVRKIAQDLNLPVYNKPDSQEICFVPDQDYAALVKRRTPQSMRHGDLVLSGGGVVGQHEGHQHFTIGQRKGVGVALGHPIYVVDIDPQSNRVTLGEKSALLRPALRATQINSLTDRLPPGGPPIPCTAKIRYNHDPQPATVCITQDQEMLVRFTTPQSAITPGQAVVVYDNEMLLAGAWIESATD